MNRPRHPHTIIMGIVCVLLEFAPFQYHQLDIGLGQDAMRHTHSPVPVGFWLCTWVTFHLRGYQLDGIAPINVVAVRLCQWCTPHVGSIWGHHWFRAHKCHLMPSTGANGVAFVYARHLPSAQTVDTHAILSSVLCTFHWPSNGVSILDNAILEIFTRVQDNRY